MKKRRAPEDSHEIIPGRQSLAQSDKIIQSSFTALTIGKGIGKDSL